MASLACTWLGLESPLSAPPEVPALLTLVAADVSRFIPPPGLLSGTLADGETEAWGIARTCPKARAHKQQIQPSAQRNSKSEALTVGV